jgi:hypothetical protein
MEVLKLKIFDTITKKVSVSEFEKWLYNSKYLNFNIKGDSLVFNVVNINYKRSSAINELKEVAFEIFSGNEIFACKLEKYCFNIIRSEIKTNYKNLVKKIIEIDEHDSDFEMYWTFYNIFYSIDGYDYCEYDNTASTRIDIITNLTAPSIISKLETAKNVSEKVLILNQKVEIENQSIKNLIQRKKQLKNNKTEPRTTLKQKIFAFFKKI